MEWVIQLGAVMIGTFLSIVWTLRYDPNSLSEFELHRRVNAGEPAAKAEQGRRALLPTYQALRTIKEIVLITLLGALLLPTYQWWLGGLLFLLYIGAARTVAAQGWLAAWVWKLQVRAEKKYGHLVQKSAPFVRFLAPKKVFAVNSGVDSRDELRQLVATDTTLLSPDDKSRLLGAFDFGTHTVANAMVPAEAIATVDLKETIGPLLLDRLHKQGHNMFPVVKKDIDHIQGWLYMSDLTPLDPDLHQVKDALRPTVHYLPALAPLQDVLSAALATGRQLFIVVDDDGKTTGMVSLADALQYLCGAPLPKVAPVSTKPT